MPTTATEPLPVEEAQAALTPMQILERIQQNADILNWIVTGARDGRLSANSTFTLGSVRVFRGSAAWLASTNAFAEAAEGLGIKFNVESMQGRYTLPLDVCGDPITLIFKSGYIKDGNVRVSSYGELTQAFVGQQNQPVGQAQLSMFSEEEIAAISQSPVQRIVLLVVNYRDMTMQDSGAEYLDLYLAYPMNFNSSATKIPCEAILQLPTLTLTFQMPVDAPDVINMLPELGDNIDPQQPDGALSTVEG